MKHTSTHKVHNAFTDRLDRYLATAEIAVDKINDLLDSYVVAEFVLLFAGCIAIFLIVLSILAYA